VTPAFVYDLNIYMTCLVGFSMDKHETNLQRDTQQSKYLFVIGSVLDLFLKKKIVRKTGKNYEAENFLLEFCLYIIHIKVSELIL